MTAPSLFPSLPLSWQVGPADQPDVPPERLVPATVPGAVQLDWARAEGWPEDWHYGDRFRRFDGLEDRWWTYRTTLPALSAGPEERLVFVCGGVDYACTVRLGGLVVHRQEGMFTPFELDVTEQAAAGAVLEIVVHPAPKASPRPGREQAAHSVKPAVSYGWDWHPRLIPLGIWRETRLERRPTARLIDAELRYRLDEDLSAADLDIDIRTTPEAVGREASWSLLGPGGESVVGESFRIQSTATRLSARLASPRLWWPQGHGDQPLHTFRAGLAGEPAAITQRLGFRRIRLVMHEGGWREPADFPKSRSHPPITLEVNGRRIFAKGSNFVSTDVFPGATTAETYTPLLKLAREAHFNLLRVWGGSPVPKDAFYDQCDELGLLVWQEFPLSCNCYPDDPDYLAVLDRESRSIIRRLRRHPCLALWCGGNELFNVWSGMTDQSLPLRLLNRNCYDLDPQTPFLPTAPVDGMGHGDYRFRDEQGREIHQTFARSRHTAYTEFGVSGPTPADRLRRIIPPEELFPPRPGTAWETHHGLNAWNMDPTSWLCLVTLRHYFGEAATLEDLVEQGGRLQCEGLRFIFEEARRQHPRCSMALNWCFNEPWPSAANNSIVNWPAQPKPAYAAVAAACRPVLAAARAPQFSWRGGDTFRAELWLLNDGPQPLPPAPVTATLRLGATPITSLRWQAPAGPAQRNLAGPEVRAVLPWSGDASDLTLELDVVGQPSWNSHYSFPFRPAAPPREPRPGIRARPLNA